MPPVPPTNIKAALGHLRCLPEPLRTVAGNNVLTYPSETLKTRLPQSVSDALKSFVWEETAQGMEYWHRIHHIYRKQ